MPPLIVRGETAVGSAAFQTSRRPGLFVELSILDSSHAAGGDAAILIGHALAHACNGYQLLAVTSSLDFNARSLASRSELLATLRQGRGSYPGLPFLDVLMLRNRRDPEPYLEIGRRLNLFLPNSVLVTSSEESWHGAREAGVWCESRWEFMEA